MIKNYTFKRSRADARGWGSKNIRVGGGVKTLQKSEEAGSNSVSEKRRNDVGKFIVGFVFHVARSFSGKTQQAK